MLPGSQQRWSRFRSSPARRTPRFLLAIATVMGMLAAIAGPVTAFDPTAVTDDAAVPSVAIGIIIDRSGSMDFGEGSRTPKIALARTATNLAIDDLKTGDEAAVVVFNDRADAIVPRQPLTGSRDLIKQATNGIRADGGTDIYAGMSRMLDVMRGSTATMKHIVLMTDGESQGRSDYQPLIDQMRALGITFSTVAIGKDADQALLQRLAVAGGGQYHSVIRAEDLPTIVRMDVQTSTTGTN